MTPEALLQYIREKDIHERDGSFQGTALYWASLFTRSPDIIRILIQQGATVSAQSVHGLTPLMIASMHTYEPEVVTALIEAGADVHARPESARFPDKPTVLMLTAGEQWNKEVYHVLLDAGARVSDVDRNGRTALMYAAALQNGSMAHEEVQLLIDAGANVERRDRYGKTALMYAA
jgi:ankyrin repeat protein